MVSLYTITNRINGMVYVGQTKRPVRSRWLAHLTKTRNGCKYYLHNAIRKYGVDAFQVVEILRVETVTEASRYETLLIAVWNTTDPNIGYNLTDGGENGIPSESVRKGISDRMKGNRYAVGCRRSPEHIQLLREAHLGKSSWAKGKTFSVDHRRKMAENAKGRTLSDDTKAKIGLANRGRKRTEEARRRMGDAHLGGKRSPETKAKMAESRRRWWEAKKLIDPGFRLNRQTQTVKHSILN